MNIRVEFLKKIRCGLQQGCGEKKWYSLVSCRNTIRLEVTGPNCKSCRELQYRMQVVLLYFDIHNMECKLISVGHSQNKIHTTQNKNKTGPQNLFYKASWCSVNLKECFHCPRPVLLPDCIYWNFGLQISVYAEGEGHGCRSAVSYLA